MCLCIKVFTYPTRLVLALVLSADLSQGSDRKNDADTGRGISLKIESLSELKCNSSTLQLFSS